MSLEPEPHADPFDRKSAGTGSPAPHGDHFAAAWETLPAVPALDATSCELWLELLADNELDSIQRNALLGYLERHPEYWRACALAFWDRQCLERELDAASARTPKRDWPADCSHGSVGNLATDLATDLTENSAEDLATALASVAAERSGAMGSGTTAGDREQRPKQRRQARTRVGWGPAMNWAVTAGLALVTVALVTLGTRDWGALSESQAARVALTERLTRAQANVQELQAELSAERTVFRSLRGVFPDQPCLIEIESTADRVVYLTDGQVSEDLVRGLLSLGHVEVRPYRPVVETSLWRSLVRPVVAIEVVKDSTQYFPGDL